MDARKNDTKKIRGGGPAGERRALAVLAGLKRLYPNPRHYLRFDNPFQLLVATILSAQCTDEKVNEVTLRLFGKYPAPADFAEAPPEQIEREVRPTGFYRNKAKAIKGASSTRSGHAGSEAYVPAH